MRILLRSSLLITALLSALAVADEQSVKRSFEERFPGAEVASVKKEALTGLYEVYAVGQLFYVDEKVSYAIQGNLINTQTRQSLSAERMKVLSEISFNKLPFEQAIKIVRGNGKRQLAVFEDPDCPFCKQLERELQKVNDVTIHVFLYPIEQLHPGATLKSRKIWCAPDRAKAWLASVHDNTVPEGSGECDTPITNLAKLARTHRITGTPTLIFANNERVAGAIPAARIEQLLGNTTP
ncbi:DsbC family protein [Vogesella indigofera]|uniref:DsbC family protein n=1 Tax=Vogesella indigofera TaxID=45465 RepID=UPI00234CBECC|nr:DsbC family protein [Vogesella indigofera]MDC7705461.1 DsbC family protein [Vogesella indigofera]